MAHQRSLDIMSASPPKIEKKGILLLNLGTPDSTSVADVRRYLQEFLMDGYVIDINPLFRFLLVHGIILRTRPKKSAEAYKKIWTNRASPLLFHSQDLTTLIQKNFTGTTVELAMRYGNPSIETALKKLKAAGVTSVLAVPLYPQYALASTESSVHKIKEQAQKVCPEINFTFYPAFYDNPHYIEAVAQTGTEIIQKFKPDFYLMSFHGVPERHVKKTDPSGQHCLADKTCCDRITEANKNCYKAQSYATARVLATKLNLNQNQWSVAFQSRLGITPWISPYTDIVLKELADKGMKRLAVFCPSFVADCLETLEEIQIRAKEDFIRFGGEDLVLIPSLNSNSGWVSALSLMLKEHQT
jgi:protoporphyrin/coproporphyrin ferrochelatase